MLRLCHRSESPLLKPLHLLFGEHKADIPFPLVKALPADQQGVRLCPGVLSALRTGKLRLTRSLCSPLLACRSRLPMQLKPRRGQFCIRLPVATARDNVMADRLPGFLSPFLTGATWL